jgi:TDG/mug DNA glycosylase family protein
MRIRHLRGEGRRGTVAHDSTTHRDVDDEWAPIVNAGKPDRCFAPIAERDATVLILGSLPGRRSLELQQYYGHPRNAFWKIMGAVLAEDMAVPYERRVKLLTAHRIAVWDVLAAAERPGSLDRAIVDASAVANDFRGFFRRYPQIRRVFFNGQKSASIYRRVMRAKPGEEPARLRYAALPSTSPAHAGLSYEKKLQAWRAITRCTEGEET